MDEKWKAEAGALVNDINGAIVDEVVPVSDIECEPTRVLRLVNSVKTRWSSTYAMLSRYSKLKAAVGKYFTRLPDQAGEGVDV